MLTTSAKYTLWSEDRHRDIIITPLFLQNHNQPWQPNEIYGLSQIDDLSTTEPPVDLGKIIIDDHMNWHYEGEFDFSEDEKEQLSRFVLSQN